MVLQAERLLKKRHKSFYAFSEQKAVDVGAQSMPLEVPRRPHTAGGAWCGSLHARLVSSETLAGDVVREAQRDGKLRELLLGQTVRRGG